MYLILHKKFLAFDKYSKTKQSYDTFEIVEDINMYFAPLDVSKKSSSGLLNQFSSIWDTLYIFLSLPKISSN